MELADLVLTSLIALVGVYFAHSVTRQQRLKVAEQRVASYRKLWGHMYDARPSRSEPPENQGPLTPVEARRLHGAMTNWYFKGGDGMLLSHDTREMYLEVKRRLGRYAQGGSGTSSGRTGEQIMRNLSLLRSQMKSDLAIYGVFYFDTLTPDDREFIRASELDPDRWGRPWYRWATSPRYWANKIRPRTRTT